LHLGAAFPIHKSEAISAGRRSVVVPFAMRGPGPRRGGLLPFLRLPHRRGWRAATGPYRRDRHGLERRPGSAVLGQEAWRMSSTRLSSTLSSGWPQPQSPSRLSSKASLSPGYSPRIFPQDIPVRGAVRHVHGPPFRAVLHPRGGDLRQDDWRRLWDCGSLRMMGNGLI
jgi:hypothetical protein